MDGRLAVEPFHRRRGPQAGVQVLQPQKLRISSRAGGEELRAAKIRSRRPTFFSGRNGATVPITSSPVRRVKPGTLLGRVVGLVS